MALCFGSRYYQTWLTIKVDLLCFSLHIITDLRKCSTYKCNRPPFTFELYLLQDITIKIARLGTL